MEIPSSGWNASPLQDKQAPAFDLQGFSQVKRGLVSLARPITQHSNPRQCLNLSLMKCQ